jgi:DNA ligase (NAD+)
VPDVGPVVARSVRSFFDEPLNAALMDRMAAAGVRMVDDARRCREKAGAVWPADVRHHRHPRGDEREAGDRGLASPRRKSVTSVSKKTTGVIVGAEPGRRLEKAKAAGVPLLDEAAFLPL